MVSFFGASNSKKIEVDLVRKVGIPEARQAKAKSQDAYLPAGERPDRARRRLEGAQRQGLPREDRQRLHGAHAQQDHAPRHRGGALGVHQARQEAQRDLRLLGSLL